MSATIKMIDSNLKFYNAPVKELREDYVFNLVKNGQMSVQQFAAWVEGVRDEWFVIGMNSSNANIHETVNTSSQEENTSPQSVSSSIEFF
jgi:hypothetical protein